MQNDVTHWIKTAEEWIPWMRTDGREVFWASRDAFKQFVGHEMDRALRSVQAQAEFVASCRTQATECPP
ncbi:hypothetical protein [uncultured Roseobacter sp.]|uniref:hypothetical protein n=1 Tax=uncultured Roseobacter sp. TaxID=114847 RepID=UPI002608238F|nr:hypothetical protein [uncultured Roseobacter sp.]